MLGQEIHIEISTITLGSVFRPRVYSLLRRLDEETEHYQGIGTISIIG